MAMANEVITSCEHGMIIRTDEFDHTPDRRIKCREIMKGWASSYEVWGSLWNESKQRWEEKNLYYLESYVVERELRGRGRRIA
jgi:hypothetical protein